MKVIITRSLISLKYAHQLCKIFHKEGLMSQESTRGLNTKETTISLSLSLFMYIHIYMYIYIYILYIYTYIILYNNNYKL